MFISKQKVEFGRLVVTPYPCWFMNMLEKVMVCYRFDEFVLLAVLTVCPSHPVYISVVEVTNNTFVTIIFGSEGAK